MSAQDLLDDPKMREAVAACVNDMTRMFASKRYSKLVSAIAMTHLLHHLEEKDRIKIELDEKSKKHQSNLILPGGAG